MKIKYDNIPEFTLKFDTIRLDLVQQRVWDKDEEIMLQPSQKRVLAAMIINSGQPISNAEIEKIALGENYDPEYESNENHSKVIVHRIRKALGGDRFQTVRHVGYKLCA